MLLVVATPLGNLSDLSPRAREALEQADVIAAEDTRVIRKLLTALKIPAPLLVSYRGHDEERRALPLVERIEQGQTVALVSDAGTPNVSDPGEHLARLCHERGLPVRAIAGPSALAAAISVSGLPPVPLHFLAFPPRKTGPLRAWLRRFGAYEGTLVLYEAPGRVQTTLALVQTELPGRRVCMARELTKLHEEVITLPTEQLIAHLDGVKVRGEVVLLIGPGAAPVQEEVEVDLDSLKGIAAALATRWGCTKREAYQKLLELERPQS